MESRKPLTPPGIGAAQAGEGLRLVVPYTTPELTRRALDCAQELAHGLRAEVTLLAVQLVPFACPLSRPPVDPEHLRRQLMAIAGTSSLCTRILVVRARDREAAFTCMLAAGSLVLVATKRRWWRTAEERLVRCLSRAGHSVALLRR